MLDSGKLKHTIPDKPLSSKQNISKIYQSMKARLIGSDCTITDLIVDNERCINDFQNVGERIVLIDFDYKLAIRNLLA